MCKALAVVVVMAVASVVVGCDTKKGVVRAGERSNNSPTFEERLKRRSAEPVSARLSTGTWTGEKELVEEGLKKEYLEGNLDLYSVLTRQAREEKATKEDCFFVIHVPLDEMENWVGDDGIFSTFDVLIVWQGLPDRCYRLMLRGGDKEKLKYLRKDLLRWAIRRRPLFLLDGSEFMSRKLSPDKWPESVEVDICRIHTIAYTCPLHRQVLYFMPSEEPTPCSKCGEKLEKLYP